MLFRSDIPDISQAIQFTAPDTLSTWMQLAGRSGRSPNINARAILLIQPSVFQEKGRDARKKGEPAVYRRTTPSFVPSLLHQNGPSWLSLLYACRSTRSRFPVAAWPRTTPFCRLPRSPHTSILLLSITNAVQGYTSWLT